MIAARPGERVAAQVESWPGVSSALPFPRRIRDELIAARRARPHHVLPDSGWVTASIDPADVEPVIELFRLAYERAAAAAARRTSAPNRS
ncbi:MAG: hypothetical protein AUG48_05075 [Actinobacteria bacterium 13_1_20CM_3_68_9]|nr:MAG: hypothetical protein AUG48_05075 [Actinobacteria bacterium 13_1_20CM_3_68_9]